MNDIDFLWSNLVRNLNCFGTPSADLVEGVGEFRKLSRKIGELNALIKVISKRQTAIVAGCENELMTAYNNHKETMKTVVAKGTRSPEEVIRQLKNQFGSNELMDLIIALQGDLATETPNNES